MHDCIQAECRSVRSTASSQDSWYNSCKLSRSLVDDLAVDVAQLHNISVHNAQPPHARSRQVQRRRRAQPARTDDEHGAAAQAGLRCRGVWGAPGMSQRSGVGLGPWVRAS